MFIYLTQFLWVRRGLAVWFWVGALSWGCGQGVSQGFQLSEGLTGYRVGFHSGSHVCLPRWCRKLAESFSPVPYGLHKAAWELSRHGSLASCRGSNRRERKIETTVSPEWALEVTHCHFFRTLLATRLAPFSVREGYIRVWISGGQDHWRLPITKHRLWNLSSTSYSYLPSLICKMGISAQVIVGVNGVDVKHSV